MRFPKTILLQVEDEVAASVLKVVLHIKRFRTIRAIEAGEPKPDMVLVVDGAYVACDDLPVLFRDPAWSVADMIERMHAVMRQAVVQRHGDTLRAHAKARKVTA